MQGFGNVGSIGAYLLQDQGLRVVALSDSRGGIYRAAGLDGRDVVRFKRATGSVVGYPDAEPVTNSDLLILPVDVLVPAALEKAIDSHNADEIRARVIVEGANGPTTPDADEILTDKGVLIVPDILANSGGVIVSYFEWVQNLQNLYWSEADVNARLTEMIGDAFRDVLQISREKKVNMRVAAYIKAIARVARAIQLRGVYP